jgi:hypothetical protein
MQCSSGHRCSGVPASAGPGVHHCSGVPASAGPGVPFRMRLPRQVSHRLMNVACFLPTSLLWSPGFSRTRRSLQDASAPADIHRLMNVACFLPTSLLWSPGFSRTRRSRQDAAAPAGIPPAQAGTPGYFISGLCSQRSSASEQCVAQYAVTTSVRLLYVCAPALPDPAG